MSLHFRKLSMRVGAIMLFAVLAVIFTPHSTFATAGQGGGGSGTCSGSNFCTSFGAVWRYRTTSGNTTIPGLFRTSVAVNGCGPFGGFFEYVLAAKNGGTDVRSWEIGRTTAGSNNNTYRSTYFGGATAYRPTNGDNGVSLPSTLSDGQDYSWAAVNAAFNAMPTPQKNGYSWDGDSRLGWFCYLTQSSDFSLTPTISVNPTISESGGTATAISTVTNGGTTASSSVNWQVTTFTLNPSDAIPAAGTSTSGVTPESYYGHGATKASSGTGVFQKNVTSPNPIPNLNQTIGDYPVGTKLCYALSVQPYNQNTTDWKHSLPSCITIAKRPKVHILGGDLIVGTGTTSNIVTSTLTKTVSGKLLTFGSWGEYGAIASGTITSFGSGAGYAGGQASGAVCDASLLTFTNAGSGPSCTVSTPKGGYANASLLPDISSRLIATKDLGSNPTVNLASAITGSYSATGNVTVNGGTIGAGKWIVINAPTATVTIKSNIIYDPAAVLHSIADIPQVVIIANTINIDGGVTQADTWLIATGAAGNLNTCTQVTNPTIAGQLNAGICNQALTVNGPVVARHLYLYRTAGAGSGAASGDPSEVFNLRPDAYLWATNYSISSGRLQTVTTKELPPRF